MEKFNLKWHTFQPHINDSYKELYETKSFSDVTLVSNDHKQFKAHKFILSSSSTMFKSILGDDNVVAPFIFLRGVNHLELESILQFMYLGEATFDQERLNILLDVAHDLKIKEIGENKHNEPKNKLPSSEESSKQELFDDATDFVNTDELLLEARTAKINTGQSEWSCSLCDKMLRTAEGLKYHIESKHNGKKYPCKQCDNIASSKSSLSRHVKSIHEGLRYLCNQCDFQATRPIYLRNHTKSKHMG